MKKLIYTILMLLLFQNCSVYNVSILNDTGEVTIQHETRKIYTGTESFIIDAIVNPLVMVYSLFVPLPRIHSSVGISGGMSLKSYINTYYTLSPITLQTSGNNNNWIIFDAKDGNEYTYSGLNYTLNKKTKGEKVSIEWGGKFKKIAD